MKPEEIDVPEASWEEFYLWACAEADRESEGMPETILINGPDQP